MEGANRSKQRRKRRHRNTCKMRLQAPISYLIMSDRASEARSCIGPPLPPLPPLPSPPLPSGRSAFCEVCSSRAACVIRTSWGRSGTSSSSASRPSRWATASARTTRTCSRTWSVGELRVAHRYASNPSSRWTLVEFPPPPAPGARRGDVGAEALRMRTHAHARRRVIRFLPFTPNRG